MTQYPDLAAIVRTSQGDHPIWVGWNTIDEIGERRSEPQSNPD